MAADSPWSSPHNSHSDRSTKTQSTAPTEYSARTPEAKFIEENDRVASMDMARDKHHTYHDPLKASYASTIPSEDEDSELDLVDSYEVLSVPDSGYASDAIASNPRDFAQFFPSANRISIRHDDATIDGNMNLRLDTWIPTKHGKRRPMTLFHLRLLDLAQRDFSLRRYCRDSGREVCRSIRKFHEPQIEQKPSLQRSLSNAIASFRRRNTAQSQGSPVLTRADSGYCSMNGDDSRMDPSSPGSRAHKRPTNKIKLEFSNYAHIDVHRHGRGSSKRYEFEYWGVKYSWQRRIKQDGDFTVVSFHLFRDGNTIPSAHIVPDALTTWQAEEERDRGGWVPPCSLWLKDPDIINYSPDVSDVVVATGLMALVDDCIKRTWPSRRRRTFNLPLFDSPLYLDLKYIGPKQLIDEVFNRPTTSRRHSQRAPPALKRRRSTL